MGSSTDAREFRKAIFDRCVILYAADVDPYTRVVRGLPAFADAQDNVCVGVVTSNQEAITLSTQRSREEILTCEVTFYSFRFGGDEMEEVVEGRAWEMLDELAQYVRVTDTTLGGVVRQCFLTDVASDAATDPDVLAKGRMHVITATFTAENRVRS
jgi:hypothetical protein